MTEHVTSPPPGVYTAIIKQDGVWWVGWIEEIPGINCQEESREALSASLKEALGEALAFNRREALDAAGSGYSESRLRYETPRSPATPQCKRVRGASGSWPPFVVA